MIVCYSRNSGNTFVVGDATSQYNLSIGAYGGNAGQQL